MENIGHEDGVMKAWVATEDNDESIVFFAVSEEEATKLAIAYKDWGDLCVSRVSELDRYAEQGHVPDDVLIAYGWEVSCAKCGHLIDAHGCWECFNKMCFITKCNEECMDGTLDSVCPNINAWVVDDDKAYCSEKCRKEE